MPEVTTHVFQCRGADGNLEKDVGVLVNIDGFGGVERVKCPYYRGVLYNEIHRCVCKGDKKSTRCFLY
jgi:hypothetical protein